MEEVSKSKALERDEVTETITIESKSTPFAELDEEVKIAIAGADEKKAFNIVALDLRAITSFTEFFVITHGQNRRHVQAIADEIARRLRKEKKIRPVRTEGYSGGEWVLIDYGDFVAHIFNGDSREFYDLERLWRDAARVEIELDQPE